MSADPQQMMLMIQAQQQQLMIAQQQLAQAQQNQHVHSHQHNVASMGMGTGMMVAGPHQMAYMAGMQQTMLNSGQAPPGFVQDNDIQLTPEQQEKIRWLTAWKAHVG